MATARISAAGDALLARRSGRGVAGQFVVGALLGVVWTPCVGPTLGAASTLAASGRRLGAVAALMLVFGIGAAAPMLAARHALTAHGRRCRDAVGSAPQRPPGACSAPRSSSSGHHALGADKAIETWLVDHSPGALTELTTRF